MAVSSFESKGWKGEPWPVISFLSFILYLFIYLFYLFIFLFVFVFLFRL